MWFFFLSSYTHEVSTKGMKCTFEKAVLKPKYTELEKSCLTAVLAEYMEI